MSAKKTSIRDLLATAAQAQKAGDAVRAQSIYAAILAKFPKHGKAKKELARLQKAGGGANRMTAADAQALGQMLAQGQFEAVLDQVNLLLVHNRKEPFLYNIQGLAQFSLGRHKAAINSLKQAIRLNPNHVEAHNNLGMVYIKDGQTDQAIPILRKAIAMRANYPEAHHNLGVALAANGQEEDALAAYNKALELRPNYANALNSRANLLRHAKQAEAAIRDFKAALALAPNDAEIVSNLAGTYAENGLAEDAFDMARKALQLQPDNPDYMALVAMHEIAAGKFGEARARLHGLLAKNPDHGDALLNLATLQKASASDPLFDLVKTALQSVEMADEDRVRAGFAQAKILEDVGDYAASFASLQQANQLNHSLLQDNEMDQDDNFEHLKQTYSKQAVQEVSEFGDASDTPILVVGLMRSGTSLVEQILASHSRIFGAGERMILTDLVEEFGLNRKLPTVQERKQVAQRYLQGLRLLAPDAPHITDKMPGNFLHIGALKLALPNVKIINMVRDPRDNCYSIYKNFFDTPAHRYAYDLADLARFANQYKSLMAHWQEVFPDQIYNCRYEDLIADQEGETRKLLDYCGLEWEPQLLDFHKTERAVRTASVSQVRRRIYKTSVRSWEHVQEGLQPLIDNLDVDLWADYLK